MKGFEAIKIFDEMVKSPRLCNTMPNTGCFARADEVCKKMTEQGVEPMVVLASRGRGFLQGRVLYRPDGQTDQSIVPCRDDVNWSFHIAAAAKVKDANGKEDMLVFDTALFEAPVTVDAWSKTMFVDERPITEADIRVLPYNGDGAKFIQDVYKSANCEKPEDFFAKQPNKYLGKKVIKRPSVWLNKYNNDIGKISSANVSFR